MKKLFSFLLAGSFLGFFLAAPAVVFAECRDTDGDRYYFCDFEEDELSPFAQGREEERCDQVNIGEEYDSIDWALVVAPGVTAEGSDVHPDAIEPPNSDVDYDCDGEIAGYLPEGRGDGDLMNMVEKIITLIGQVAVYVSVAALVYGGIMFATAAGEETKIQKAKKTIVGAVIGLIIGLIAWNIVGFVTSTFGS